MGKSNLILLKAKAASIQLHPQPRFAGVEAQPDPLRYFQPTLFKSISVVTIL